VNVLTNQLGRAPTIDDVFPLMAPGMARSTLVNAGNKNPTDEDIRKYVETHQEALREDIAELDRFISMARNVQSLDTQTITDQPLSSLVTAPKPTTPEESFFLDPKELLSLSPLSRDIYLMLVGEEKRSNGRTPEDLARNSQKLFNTQLPREEIEKMYRRARNHIELKRKVIGRENTIIVTDFDSLLCAITGLNQTNGPARERINNLKPLERKVLELVYFQGYLLEEAGKELSIKTKQRVGQISKDAIAALKGQERPSLIKSRTRRNRDTSQ
jgi:DNA-directed RNA polymerase specialized sigma subunit